MSRDILNYFVELISNYAEVFLILYFIERFLKSKYTGKKKKIVFWFSSFAIFLVSSVTQYINLNYVPSNYSSLFDLITILMYTVFSIFFTSKKLLLKIIIPAIECSSVILISVVVNMAISELTKISADNLLLIDSEKRLLSIILIKLLFFVLMLIFEKFFKPSNENFEEYETIILSSMILISLVLVTLMVDLRMKYSEFEYANMVCIIGIVSLVIVDLFIISVTRLLIKKNTEIVDLTMYKNNFDINEKIYSSVKEIYSELKIFQHDEKNMLLPLYRYIQNNENENALKYLNKIENDSVSKFIFFVNRGIEEIDTILNIKLNIARNKNIDITCSVQNAFDGFDSKDVVCLLSNAIDNAIEASAKENDKRIDINIYKKKSYLCISITNKISESVLGRNKHLKTTKVENTKNHGYGIKSIKRITDKYGGYYDCYEYGSTFVLDAFLLINY